MYRSFFPRDLFAELDRLQRDVQQGLELTPTIRGVGRSSFPAINVGGTPESVEIYAFAPGIDPAKLDIQIDHGMLNIAGERRPALPEGDGEAKDERKAPASAHISERFHGRFQRVLSLPDDVDPEKVEANYRDGVLHVSVARRASAQPRRISVQ